MTKNRTMEGDLEDEREDRILAGAQAGLAAWKAAQGKPKESPTKEHEPVTPEENPKPPER